MSNVIFEQKTSPQDICINESHGCPNQPIQQAFCKKNNFTARIACCHEPYCMSKAEQLAYALCEGIPVGK